MENLNNTIQTAIDNGTAQILTVETAKNLKGKKIITKYFGYRGQDGVDSFIVGEVIEKDWIKGYEPKIKELLREDGSSTFIRNHFMLSNEDKFSCSDSDRFVYFIVVE